MKQGRTLAELAKAIQRVNNERKDFKAPTNKLRYEPDGDVGRIGLTVGRKEYHAKPTNHCLRQITDRSGIPAKYADRLRGENCQLLADNITWWWQHKPEKRMVRTLMNGTQVARAFVSDIYRPLENADLAAIILPKLARLGCEVKSCEITETRMYIQAVTPKIQAKVVGDIVQAGIVAGNSEVGEGSIFLDPMIYKCGCLNGLILPRVLKRHHVGRRSDDDLPEAEEYYTDATKELDDRAFWSKVKDVVDGLFDKDRFAAMVAKFEGTAQQKIKGQDAVEEVKQRFQLNEDETNNVLNHLIEGGDSSLFGLINAVTRTASDVESYDRYIELQRIGGRIIELPAKVWS